MTTTMSWFVDAPPSPVTTSQRDDTLSHQEVMSKDLASTPEERAAARQAADRATIGFAQVGRPTPPAFAVLHDNELRAYRSWFGRSWIAVNYEFVLPADLEPRLAATIRHYQLGHVIFMHHKRTGERLVVAATLDERQRPVAYGLIVQWSQSSDMLTPRGVILRRYRRRMVAWLGSQILLCLLGIGSILTIVGTGVEALPAVSVLGVAAAAMAWALFDQTRIRRSD